MRTPVGLAAGALAAAASLPIAALHAQAPVGQLILSTYKSAGNNGVPGLGGLYFIDPTTGAVTTVTGLPCEITGSCPTSVAVDGADVVVNLPETGQIIATAWGPIGQPLSLFRLDLNGSSVVASERYDLATVASFDGLANTSGALLPDGRVLLLMDQRNLAAPGGLLGAPLGVFDPTLPASDPNALTAVLTNFTPAGAPNAMVVDQALGMAYVAFNTVANRAIVYQIPVPAGGSFRQVGVVTLEVNAMALEPDGQLLLGGAANSASVLARLDPRNGRQTNFPQAFGNDFINALRIDPVTGDLFLAERDASLSRLSPRDVSGTLQQLGNGGPGGWGRPSGLDMQDELRNYGVASGAGDVVRWELGPNPGGSSTLGNASFSLTCAAGDPGTSAFWAFGAQSIRQTISLGTPIELLVQPVVLLTTQVRPAPVGNRIDLSLPVDPSLRGTHLYVQCLVPRGSDLGASSGLDVTLR